MIRLAAVAAALLAQIVAPAPQQEPLRQNRAPVPIAAPPGLPTAPSPAIDRDFAIAAVESSHAEIAMAKLALERSHTDEVRGFAQKMISEHTGLMAALMPAIALVLPPARMDAKLSPPDELTYYDLQHVPDVDFDHTYALAEVGGHIAAYGAFTTESTDGTNAPLKMLAKQWSATIEAHLELAVAMAKHVAGANPLR